MSSLATTTLSLPLADLQTASLAQVTETCSREDSAMRLSHGDRLSRSSGLPSDRPTFHQGTVSRVSSGSVKVSMWSPLFVHEQLPLAAMRYAVSEQNMATLQVHAWCDCRVLGPQIPEGVVSAALPSLPPEHTSLVTASKGSGHLSWQSWSLPRIVTAM